MSQRCLWGYSAFRRGLLCPRRQSNQNAAETPLVSDFRFCASGRASRQRKLPTPNQQELRRSILLSILRLPARKPSDARLDSSYR